MTVKISNLKYANADHTAIDMDVSGVIENETIPFTYRSDDTAPLSIEIKEVLAIGEHDIGEYTVPPDYVPTSASKLGLKRAFSELGQWDNVKAYLAANPDLQEDWDLAVQIKRTDPLTQGAITALGLTDQQADDLLVRANELVA